MPISVSCPGCKANFKAPDQMAGRAASCPKCQTKLQIPALATATALPMATAIPSAPAKKPPLPQAQPLNTAPVTPAAVTPPNVPAETPPAKESIWKKKWTADKIILNVIAIIIFVWVMKGAAEVLMKGLADNQQVQPNNRR